MVVPSLNLNLTLGALDPLVDKSSSSSSSSNRSLLNTSPKLAPCNSSNSLHPMRMRRLDILPGPFTVPVTVPVLVTVTVTVNNGQHKANLVSPNYNYNRLMIKIKIPS